MGQIANLKPKTEHNLADFNWYEVLPLFGIHSKFLVKKHGPCPLPGCSWAETPGQKRPKMDRFRFDNKGGTGTYFCNWCGAGNAWKLIKACSGLSDTEIAKKLHDIKGGNSWTAEPALPPQSVDELSPEEVERNRPRLKQASDGSVPVIATDPVGRYLSMRVPGCDLSKLSRFIRFNPSMEYLDEEVVEKEGRHDTRIVKRGSFPVMLAKVIDGQDQPITLHRTYLTAAGTKAPFEKVKKQMAGVRKLRGAAIRVCDVPESRELAICEGIETAWAIATAKRYKVNVWSMLNCHNIGCADIPNGRFDSVIIYADHDKLHPKHGYRPGEHYAQMLKEKLKERGIPCEIKIPTVEGTDFADIWVDFYKTKCRMPASFDGTGTRPQTSVTKEKQCLTIAAQPKAQTGTTSMSKWAGIDR